MNRPRLNSILLILVASTVAMGCQQPNAPATLPSETAAGPVPSDSAGERTFKVEVWADNWFAAYLGDTLIAEDSVPITTERSFNAETFTFQATFPVQLNFIAKDFKENDTGLEYIGSQRQQMGDGGFIAQVTDVESGQVVAVTNHSWKALVTHRGPADVDCVLEQHPVAGVGPCAFVVTEAPADWMTPTFDDSPWPNATEHSAQAVRPKDGYDKINWAPDCKIIWVEDLEKDNTILLRTTIPAP